MPTQTVSAVAEGPGRRQVFIYTRFSSDMQRSESCDIQERRVRELLGHKGIDATYARVIRDEALSGTREDRAGFQELERAVREGQVAVVAVYDLSRLSRALNVRAFVQDLNYAGGRLLSVMDHIDSAEPGWELPVTFGELKNSYMIKEPFRDFDLVLWDDGSTDGSQEILGKLADSDSRIRLCGGKHIGTVPAYARAIAASKGEYLGWVDSDDLLAPTALAQTVEALDAHPEVGLVYTDHYEMNEAGKAIRYQRWASRRRALKQVAEADATVERGAAFFEDLARHHPDLPALAEEASRLRAAKSTNETGPGR